MSFDFVGQYIFLASDFNFIILAFVGFIVDQWWDLLEIQILPTRIWGLSLFGHISRSH